MEGPLCEFIEQGQEGDGGALEEPILISLDANILTSTLADEGSSSKSSEILFGLPEQRALHEIRCRWKE